MWTVRLHTIPEDKLPELEEYCYEAHVKDSTFRFIVEGEDGNVKSITITCTSKDQAYRRGSLFHHRFGCFYEVEWRKEDDGKMG